MREARRAGLSTQDWMDELVAERQSAGRRGAEERRPDGAVVEVVDSPQVAHHVGVRIVVREYAVRAGNAETQGEGRTQARSGVGRAHALCLRQRKRLAESFQLVRGVGA